MTEGFTGKRTFVQHWPVVLLGIAVALIFLAALVVFDVRETDHAIVMRFGRPKREVVDGEKRIRLYKPGLRLKWPYPIDTVWRHDNRLQCYELTKGQVEQVQTADDYQIIVTTFVLWRVGDPALFLKRIDTTSEAEVKLDNEVRNCRNIVIGRHKLSEFINANQDEVRIAQIESEILNGIHTGDFDVKGVTEVAMEKYGIDVTHLGFKHIGFPEAVSTKVFDRMKAERDRKSEEHLARGESEAKAIRARAEKTRRTKLAVAMAGAKRIRGEGDQAAAKHYAVFRENPELAKFLRKLDSLRLTLSAKTTLIVDTNTPPFDLLLPGATDLPRMEPQAGAAAKEQGGAK